MIGGVRTGKPPRPRRDAPASRTSAAAHHFAACVTPAPAQS
ncbi:hypothetical protein BSLA_02f2385 [Burkholderia stabilis]|nr:hypothetical protein BSLA_02f2385 [Burkholderia stabilis]